MVEKPSDLQNKKTSRLTRRRVMKMAGAAGFGAATAANMTVDDVKAAASDQVTISFDISGRTKKQVPADWYDQVQRAKKATERIKEKYMGREGIVGIGRDAGGGARGNGNPSVNVVLDSGSNAKDERRGELPERANGTPVKIEEQDPDKRTADNHEDTTCNAEAGDVDALPGGTGYSPSPTTDPSGICTYGSRFINGTDRSWLFGWSVAAHCIASCTASDQAAYHTSDQTGNVIFLDGERDIAYVERLSGTSPVSEVVTPSDHTFSVHISDTVSESGMATIEGDNNFEVITQGTGGCRSEGVLNRYDYGSFFFDIGFCSEYLTDLYELSYPNGSPPEGGDSGATPYVRDDSSGDYFVVGSHSGHANDGSASFGPAGYGIQQAHNIWWSDI